MAGRWPAGVGGGDHKRSPKYLYSWVLYIIITIDGDGIAVVPKKHFRVWLFSHYVCTAASSELFNVFSAMCFSESVC